MTSNLQQCGPESHEPLSKFCGIWVIDWLMEVVGPLCDAGYEGGGGDVMFVRLSSFAECLFPVSTHHRH